MDIHYILAHLNELYGSRVEISGSCGFYGHREKMWLNDRLGNPDSVPGRLLLGPDMPEEVRRLIPWYIGRPLCPEQECEFRITVSGTLSKIESTDFVAAITDVRWAERFYAIRTFENEIMEFSHSVVNCLRESPPELKSCIPVDQFLGEGSLSIGASADVSGILLMEPSTNPNTVFLADDLEGARRSGRRIIVQAEYLHKRLMKAPLDQFQLETRTEFRAYRGIVKGQLTGVSGGDHILRVSQLWAATTQGAQDVYACYRWDHRGEPT